MWTIHPKPQPGESLTSWLIRIAAAKGVRQHCLVNELVPRLEFWTRDGDLIAPLGLINALAQQTGTPIDCALQTRLQSYEGVLDEIICGERQSSMVIPLGVKHRIRRAHGQQFCPLCLNSEPAYLRLFWRLRLFPVCTRHAIVLKDACEACGAPMMPHRGGIVLCSTCGVDLRGAAVDVADPNVITLQRHNEMVLNGHAVMWPFLQGMHPLAFFGLQMGLLRAVTSRSWGKRLRAGLEARLGAMDLRYRETRPHLRSMHTASVHEALRAVELLLRGWPAMFAGICQESKSWGSWIVPEDPRSKIPFTLRQAIDTYLRPGSAHMS